MNKSFLPFLALVLFAAAAGPASSEEVKAGGRWALQFEHGPLKIVRVQERPGVNASYHYQVIKVTNPTGLARPWSPLVEAVTDTKKTTVAVGNRSALPAIREAEKNDALVAIESTAGKIEAGETKTTVAIIGPLDPNYDRVEVRIHGLVNPITTYKFETYGEGLEVIVDSAYLGKNNEVLRKVKAAAAEAGGTMPQPTAEFREVRESRVWAMTYERLGDEFGRDADPIRFVNEDWKILGDTQVLRVVGK